MKVGGVFITGAMLFALVRLGQLLYQSWERSQAERMNRGNWQPPRVPAPPPEPAPPQPGSGALLARPPAGLRTVTCGGCQKPFAIGTEVSVVACPHCDAQNTVAQPS